MAIFLVYCVALLGIMIATLHSKIHVAWKTAIAIFMLTPIAVILGLEASTLPLLFAFFCMLIIASTGVIVHNINKLSKKLDSVSKYQEETKDLGYDTFSTPKN